jgi:muramoyltetrapeptide carboxypeptidase
MLTRRNIISGLTASMAARPIMAVPASLTSGIRKPQRIRPGDTIGLIEPASASDDAFDLTLVEEAIVAMGLKPKRAPHLLDKFGYLAGQDNDRAADIYFCGARWLGLCTVAAVSRLECDPRQPEIAAGL